MVSESFVHACAGGAGGLISMTITYPLMGISTRAAVDHSKNPRESLLRAVQRVIETEGARGLYDGLSSSLIGIGVSNFVYYFFFEAARDFIITSKKLTAPKAGALGTLSTLESIVAGLVAGTATAVISNPIWVVNTRQTVRVTAPATDEPGDVKKVVKRLSFLQTLRSVVDKDGVRALWKGIGPALVLVTNPVLQYTVFEQLKRVLLQGRVAARAAMGAATASKPLLHDLDYFWLGALSKLVATSITYPQIVIKSRRQAMSNEPGVRNPNVWSAMTDVIRDEGYVQLGRAPCLTQLCRPVSGSLEQAAPVDPHCSDPLCYEGAHLPDDQAGTVSCMWH